MLLLSLICVVLLPLALQQTVPAGALKAGALEESGGTVLVVEDLVTIKLEILGLLEIPENIGLLEISVVDIQENIKIITAYLDILLITENSSTVKGLQQTTATRQTARQGLQDQVFFSR